MCEDYFQFIFKAFLDAFIHVIENGSSAVFVIARSPFLFPEVLSVIILFTHSYRCRYFVKIFADSPLLSCNNDMIVFFLYTNVLGDFQFDPSLILRRHNLLAYTSKTVVLALHDVTLSLYLLKRRRFPYCRLEDIDVPNSNIRLPFYAKSGVITPHLLILAKACIRNFPARVINLFKFSYVSVILHNTQVHRLQIWTLELQCILFSSCFVIVRVVNRLDKTLKAGISYPATFTDI